MPTPSFRYLPAKMRRRTKRNPHHTPFLNAVSFVLPLVCIILLSISFGAGTHPKALTQLYYYKVHTAALSLPSRLSDSQALQDLSAVSGTGLVGQPVTAATLELAAEYTIHLLTLCSHAADGSGTVVCTTPKFGYVFDPRTALHLDDTVLQGRYSAAFTFEVAQHSKISPFVAGAHAVAIGLLLVGVLGTCFAGRRPRLALALALNSWIAAFLGIAAGVAEAVGAVRFVSIFNNEFEAAAGISATLGQLFVLSLAAAALAVVTSVVLSIRYRCSKQYRRSLVRGSLSAEFLADDDDDDYRYDNALRDKEAGHASRGAAATAPANESPTKSMRPLALLQRVPTWGRKHSYAQVERQAGAKPIGLGLSHPSSHSRSASYYRRREDDRAVLMMDPAGDHVIGEEHDAAAMKRLSSGSGDEGGSPNQGQSRRNASPAPPTLTVETGDYAEGPYDPYKARARGISQ